MAKQKALPIEIDEWDESYNNIFQDGCRRFKKVSLEQLSHI